MFNFTPALRAPKFSAYFVLFAFFSASILFAQEADVPVESSTPLTERQSGADSTANLKQLQNNLSSILRSKIFKNAKVGLSVFSLDKNRSLYEYNAHQALTPASTTKLFYGYAAMKTLGAEYMVPTQVVHDGVIGSDSVLQGNLYLVGHGDCLLEVSDIEALAERIRRAGIKSIQGDIVADNSFFDDITDRQQYSGDRERMEALPPISALGVNRNIVTVLVSNNGGGVPRVQTIPQSAAFRVSIKNASVVSSDAPASSGSAPKKKQSGPSTQPSPRTRGSKAAARTKKSSAQPRIQSGSKKKKRSHSQLIPEYPEYSVDFPVGDYMLKRAKSKASSKAGRRQRRSARVSSSMQADGIQEFYVNGVPPRNSTQSFSYEMRKPAMAAAGILYRSLNAEGIALGGKVREGIASPQFKLIAEVKRPIVELLIPVNKNSDNFIAEHLMKIVGATCCGNKQCNVNAFQTLSSILDSAHIPLDGCSLFDGSGLSRRNKTSVSTQLAMLKNISEQPFSGVFYNTMAIAGFDGTLRKRMIGTAAQGNAHAKTGTHGNVSALSGYVRTRDGERLCFAMISNGAGVGGFKMLENAVVVQLAEFSIKDGTIAVPSIR